MSASLLIRADAAPAMGTGHVMRCLALAQAAKVRGIPVRLVGRVNVRWVRERLRTEGVAFTALEGEVPEKEAPEDLFGQPSDNFSNEVEGVTPWVVLDGYHFGLDCQKAVRAAGYKLLVIDDYCHLPEYSCDILLNQNIGAEKFAYTGDIGAKLLGPEFALLRCPRRTL